MQAGGPGSGRHPEYNAMVKHARSQGFSKPIVAAPDYSKQGNATKSNRMIMYKGDQDHQLNIHQRTGNWDLSPLGRPGSTGTGLASLKSTLAKRAGSLR